MEPRKLTGGDLDVFIENEVPRTQSWLYDTIQGFVNDDCDVFISTAASDAGATFTVRVSAGDVGKVIGKQGRMARSLRSLLLARARKIGVVYTLDIEQEAATHAGALLARAS